MSPQSMPKQLLKCMQHLGFDDWRRLEMNGGTRYYPSRNFWERPINFCWLSAKVYLTIRWTRWASWAKPHESLYLKENFRPLCEDREISSSQWLNQVLCVYTSISNSKMKNWGMTAIGVRNRTERESRMEIAQRIYILTSRMCFRN